jgi:hypothetical protein
MFQPILFVVCGLSQTPLATPGPEFYRFCDNLMRAETNLRLDHAEVLRSKNSARSRSMVMADLKNERKLAEDFQDADYPSLAKSLESFIATADVLQTVVAGGKERKEVYEEKAAWGNHGKRFRDVIGAFWKCPGFSIGQINPAIYYNTAPRMQDGTDATVLADADVPGEAKVWKTFGTPKPKLKRGDSIVAYWLPEDEKWVEVKSWRDIQMISDFAVEDEDQKIKLRVDRHGKVMEVVMDFVPVLQDSD